MTSLRWMVLTLLFSSVGCKTGDNDTVAKGEPPAPKPAPVKSFVTEINELATRSLKDKGVTKTDCPAMITAETAEFDCTAEATATNGLKKVPVHARMKSKGSYDFTIGMKLLDAVKVAALAPEALAKAVSQVDCGTGVIYLNVGDSFECKAVNVATQKPAKVTGKLLPSDEIDFKMLLVE